MSLRRLPAGAEPALTQLFELVAPGPPGRLAILGGPLDALEHQPRVAHGARQVPTVVELVARLMVVERRIGELDAPLHLAVLEELTPRLEVRGRHSDLREREVVRAVEEALVGLVVGDD